MATLKLEALRKRYGVVDVIHGVDLEIADGEFVSLIGASGCGKSTLLRMMAGLEEITEGRLLLNGKVINDVQPKDRDIAMVFQNYALYPHLTVAENMGFSLRLRGVTAPRIKAAVAEAAEILGLGPFLKRYPKALSGGQRQRVAMGRAIVRQPQVFLFDEPLSNLDAGLRVQMRSEIRALQRRFGTTSIYVTHDQLEAMTMSDRIVVLNGGRIEQSGAPLDVYDNPANLFVATFIGSPRMNLINARVVPGPTGAELHFGDVVIPVGMPFREATEVVLGVRPEHLRPVEGDGAGRIPFSVEMIELTGAESHLYGQLAGAPGVVAVPGRVQVRERQVVMLSVEARNLHLFEKATGQRMN
jgi:multiple sugar transport system ATP-binding protein